MSNIVDEEKIKETPSVSEILNTQVGGAFAKGSHPTNTADALPRPLTIMVSIGRQVAKDIISLSTDLHDMDPAAFTKAHPVAASIMNAQAHKTITQAHGATDVAHAPQGPQNVPGTGPDSGKHGR